MTAYLRNPLTYVWAVLTLVTLASWYLGRSGAEFRINPIVTGSVLLIALIKSRLVLRYFMEVRTAPAWLQRACDGWLIVLFATLFIVYYFSLTQQP